MGASDSSAAQSPAAKLYVGIDVSKEKLDLAASDRQAVQTFANDPAGIAAIVGLLKAMKPAMIVVESTGGLERPLLEALLDAGLPAALVHPGRVRSFANGLGVLCKTDRIDGRLLMRFGELAAPRLAEKRSKTEAELSDLVGCRRQLVESRTRQLNRRGCTTSKTALKSLDAVLKTLQKQIDCLDQRIRELIDADDDFRHLDGLLQSVPGVGPVLSATLAAELRELGRTDRREVAALVGVAPFNCDSGKFKGKRRIRGGRADVRCALYMPTLAAMRDNPVIRPLAERMGKARKLSKVIIVACMRKLLTLINAMVRDNLRWDQLEVVKKLATNP